MQTLRHPGVVTHTSTGKYKQEEGDQELLHVALVSHRHLDGAITRPAGDYDGLNLHEGSSIRIDEPGRIPPHKVQRYIARGPSNNGPKRITDAGLDKLLNDISKFRFKQPLDRITFCF